MVRLLVATTAALKIFDSTGASGFIGQQLLIGALERWHINALSRGSAASHGNVSWRQADLFSLQSSTDALKDTDVAIYLVHSMLASTRLLQTAVMNKDFFNRTIDAVNGESLNYEVDDDFICRASRKKT